MDFECFSCCFINKKQKLLSCYHGHCPCRDRAPALMSSIQTPTLNSKNSSILKHIFLKKDIFSRLSLNSTAAALGDFMIKAKL